MVAEQRFCPQCEGVGTVRDESNVDADYDYDAERFVDKTPQIECDLCHGAGLVVAVIVNPEGD